MPATTFIAVQCFQCCTMQVKQQKKSSNKWSCVVCNQKQSVRKVFTQSAMARDVRKFVQNFNMSRQFSDQNPPQSEEIEELEEQKPKRIDWSEYVDDQDEYGGKFDEEEGDNRLEAMVVTEIPKALFKKPKLKEYSSNGYGSEKMFKPSFPSRRNSKRQLNEISQDKESQSQMACERALKKTDYSNEEPRSSHSTDRAPKWNPFKAQIQDSHSNSSISKWNDYITQEVEDHNVIEAQMGRLHHTTAAKGPVSKWSSFITEEDEDEDDDILGSGRAMDSLGHVSDFKVDDDVIHPDFL